MLSVAPINPEPIGRRPAAVRRPASVSPIDSNFQGFQACPKVLGRVADDTAPSARRGARLHHAALPLSCACLLVVALSGCGSLAPSYQQPALPVPTTYPTGPHDVANVAGSARSLAWEHYFTDPQLQQLIRTALDNNRDLRTALLRVEEARASFRIQRAERFPALSIDAQGARSKVPGDLNTSGRSLTSGEHRAEVGLSSWELDLWGRVRNLESAALENWLASDASRQAVAVSLIAQVAEGYLGLREYDERVAIAQQTVASREESYRIFRRRFEVGSISKLDLIQVETLLAQAKSLHAQLARGRALQLHALAELVAADPGPLPPVVAFDDSLVLAELSAGWPSELLTHRPDIISSEHLLRARHADIGAARAAFFPKIALTGSWGSASEQLHGLFDSGSGAWAFVPTLSLPIFDGGHRSANLELATVRRDLAIADYEQTIQVAFREVSDALASRRWLSLEVETRRNFRDAQAERTRLAQLRYDNGSSAYFEVLDAQRDLLDAQQQLVETRRELLSSHVDLYAALGGGADAHTALPVISVSPKPTR
jgi:multidrug efflux system outer membrane protein